MDTRKFFLQVGTSVNNFKHERKKSLTPHEEIAPPPQKKKASHMKEKAQ